MKQKYILSDLDGVIRIFPPERMSLLEHKHGIPPGVILANAFEQPLLTSAVCGFITDEAWRSRVEEALTGRFGKSIAAAAVQEWCEFSGVVDHRYLSGLEEKFPALPVAVLTNGTTRLDFDLAQLGISSRFHRVFNSATIGFCKPDKRIYQYVVEHLGCLASEVLFIDDSHSHVSAARDFGMTAYHYQSFDEFQKHNFLESGS